MLACPKVFSALVSYYFIIVGSAQAQNPLEAQRQALDLITNTADRICNVVTTRGETQSSEVQGNIQAELGGLARRLASAGISGSGRITSNQYQNVLQSELSSTLRNNSECKLKVFDALHRTILNPIPGQTGAAQPNINISGQYRGIRNEQILGEGIQIPTNITINIRNVAQNDRFDGTLVNVDDAGVITNFSIRGQINGDTVSFQALDPGNNEVMMHYSGKVSGNTIRGTYGFSGSMALAWAEFNKWLRQERGVAGAAPSTFEVHR